MGKSAGDISARFMSFRTKLSIRQLLEGSSLIPGVRSQESDLRNQK